jgi:hypothetical protein
MNIVRTLILSALGAGALAFATPSQAAERVYISGTTIHSDRYHHHHYHDRDWERRHRGRVIIRDNGGVSVAFGGHPRHYYHRHYYRDWDHR